jgi:hypothetical protein
VLTLAEPAQNRRNSGKQTPKSAEQAKIPRNSGINLLNHTILSPAILRTWLAHRVLYAYAIRTREGGMKRYAYAIRIWEKFRFYTVLPTRGAYSSGLYSQLHAAILYGYLLAYAYGYAYIKYPYTHPRPTDHISYAYADTRIRTRDTRIRVSKSTKGTKTGKGPNIVATLAKQAQIR